MNLINFCGPVVNIIVKYIGPDVFDINVIDLKWPRKIFFRMELTCLSDIVSRQNINANQLNDYEDDQICDIDSIDGKGKLIPNTDVIYKLFYDSNDTPDELVNLYLSM